MTLAPGIFPHIFHIYKGIRGTLNIQYERFKGNYNGTCSKTQTSYMYSTLTITIIMVHAARLRLATCIVHSRLGRGFEVFHSTFRDTWPQILKSTSAHEKEYASLLHACHQTASIWSHLGHYSGAKQYKGTQSIQQSKIQPHYWLYQDDILGKISTELELCIIPRKPCSWFGWCNLQYHPLSDLTDLADLADQADLAQLSPFSMKYSLH